MASREAIELRQLKGEVDVLRRRLSERDDSYATLEKQHASTEKRGMHLTNDLLAARRAAQSSQAELDRLQREVVGLRQTRDSAVHGLEESKGYTRRLEAKLLGQSGTFLLEQNNNLRHSLEDTKRRAEGYKTLVDQQRIELHKAVREIEVLATALDMRAEELQLDGSLRSGLLYEVANAKAEVSEGIASLEAAKARGDRLEFELKEARLLLGKATTEVAELEGLLGRTEKELEEERGTRKSLEQRLSTLTHERDVSLDFVTEQSTQLSEALLRASGAERRCGEAERQCQDALTRVAAAESRAQAFKSSGEAATAAGRADRESAGDALSRATAAENAAREAGAAAQSAMARASRAEASASDSEAARGAAMSEVEGLRSTLRRLTEEYSQALGGGEKERLALSKEVGKLRGELEEARASVATSKAEREVLRTRATVAEVEAGKAREAVAALTAEGHALRTAKVTAEQSKVAQVSALRAQLAEEQAARHTWGVEAAERVKRQREKVLELSQPKVRSHLPTTPTAAGAASTAAAAAAAAVPARVVGGGGGGGGGGGEGGGLPSQAALVRDALRAAGMDEALADEYAEAVKGGRMGGRGGGGGGPLSPGEAALAEAQTKARAKLAGKAVPVLEESQLNSAWETTTRLQ